MKRIICCILICCVLCIFSEYAHAESFDLESMSTEDLMVLRSTIDSILSDRLDAKSSFFYNGIYVVGQDIKPGRYTITLGAVLEDYASIWLGTSLTDGSAITHYDDSRLIGQICFGGERVYL